MYFLLFFLSICTAMHAANVVIVGAGPVGLATAIEARAAGYDVTVIEKRKVYTRKQVHILDEHTLKLLKTWQVSVAKCTQPEGANIGIMSIQDLEEALKERAIEAGAKIIFAKYQQLVDKQAILYNGQKLSYDFLIGADGTKRPHCPYSSNRAARSRYDECLYSHQGKRALRNENPC
jgi:2-polyprenyl-6-methoxyphenol hydroxylase-like FAD-dependent oxidoreductase